MRLLSVLAVALLAVTFVHSQLVVPQFNNLQALNTFLPQIQNFLAQLQPTFQQLQSICSSEELQSLKDQLVQLIASFTGDKLDINAIKDKIRPILQQFLNNKPQSRLDFDALLQQVAGVAASVLPSLLMGLLGKRDLAQERLSISNVLSVIDKLPLADILPQIQQFLTGDKFQQLQQQLFGVAVNAISNHWNRPQLAQALQQLVGQFVPEITTMRIDWEAVAQQALNGVVAVLPSLLMGFLGKRDLAQERLSISNVLSVIDKLPLADILPQIQQFLTGDKFQQLQQQLFGVAVNAISNHWNRPQLAQALQQLVGQFVPEITTMRIDWEAVAQQALNGVVAVLPSLLMGFLGKRDLAQERLSISNVLSVIDKLPLADILPQIQQFLTGDKFQQLQQQLFGVAVNAISNHWNRPQLAQALQQLVGQFVPEITTMRIDWEAVAQQALNGVVAVLPSLLMGFLGKRDLAQERLSISNVLSVIDKLPLADILPQIQQFLTGDKFQQLQQQLFGVAVNAISNHWNRPQLAQALQQLVGQFVPEITTMRIDWEAVAQQALNGVVAVLPSLLMGFLGKRDLAQERLSISNVLSVIDKLPLADILPQIQQFLTGDKFQQLQQQLFGVAVNAISNHWNRPQLAQALQQLVGQFVPEITTMRIDWEAVAQQALNGVVAVLPSLLMGFLGKRDLAQERLSISNVLSVIDKLPLADILPQIQQFLTGDKFQQLQQQLFGVAVNAISNHWNRPQLAQALQQLVGQFVPEITTMRIDWEAVAQQALNGVVAVLPSLLVGFLGKREERVSVQALLSQLSFDKLAQIVEMVLGSDKGALFARLRKLLETLFPSYLGRINFDDLVNDLLNHVNNLLPTLTSTFLSGIFG